MSPIVLAARWRATSPKEDFEAYPFDAMGVSRTTFPRRHLHYRARDLRGASVISLRATPINCSMARPAASVPAHPDRFKHIPMLEDRLLMRLADPGRQPDPSWDLMPEIRLIVVGGTPQAAFAPDLFLVLVVVPRPLYLAAARVGTPPCTHVVRRAAAAVAGSGATLVAEPAPVAAPSFHGSAAALPPWSSLWSARHTIRPTKRGDPFCSCHRP